ncbi:MAG TPA: PEP-CTERM sorting domain-containing protein [Rhizomicrobium sp.]|nr:PEP-CTERM sorting domain-containing protein [Rhizomicrobium sp.]
MKRFWFILAAFLGLAVQAVPASADMVYTLTCDTVACSSPTNYGTVTLHQLGSGTVADPYTVEVTVNLAVAGNHFAGSGAGYAINWNITGNPDLTTTLVPTNASHPLLAGEIYDTSHFAIQDSTASGNTYKASPFGNNAWEYAIDYTLNGGNASNDNKLIFDVTKAGGLLLSNFAPTAAGFMFAVDIFKSPNGPTFVVAAKVPEPETWLLFLAGLAGLTGLVMLQRRRQLARVTV